MDPLSGFWVFASSTYSFSIASASLLLSPFLHSCMRELAHSDAIIKAKLMQIKLIEFKKPNPLPFFYFPTYFRFFRLSLSPFLLLFFRGHLAILHKWVAFFFGFPIVRIVT